MVSVRRDPQVADARRHTLHGARVTLRPLLLSDYRAWKEVRDRCGDWLTKWEPEPASVGINAPEDRDAFAIRCSTRMRERQLGTAFSFGIFHEDQFRGEINLGAVRRGAFQNAYVGYWIDEAVAGQGLMPESLVVLARFAFEDLHLHRLQVAIIPRNLASRRVVEKLELRHEGVARGYLCIDGVWEDHVRYALTAEEWDTRAEDLTARWLTA